MDERKGKKNGNLKERIILNISAEKRRKKERGGEVKHLGRFPSKIQLILKRFGRRKKKLREYFLI